jgi:copper transport protein
MAGRVALLLAVLMAAWLAAPSATRGHAELISSEPAAGVSLPESPPRLRLTFTEPIDLASSSVTLLDTQQAEVAGQGELSVDAAGTSAEVGLPELEPGTYTVSYQVTSATDGHVTSGLFAFLVDPSGTQPPPPQASQTASLSSGLDVIAARWLALLATLAAAGILLFWAASARPVLRVEHPAAAAAPWGAIALAAALALAGLVAYLVLAARPINAAGGGSTSPIPFDFAAPFGWTSFAIAMRVAMLGLAAATLLAVSRWLAPPSTSSSPWRGDAPWLAAGTAAVLVALAGMSLAGHAAAAGLLFACFDLLHLVAVAAWLGTLPGLFILASRARGAVPAALRRHSRLALVAAPLVVVTGLASSPVVLGPTPRELVASGYGNLLLAKAGLFSVAVGLGAVNFFVLRRVGHGRSLLLIGGELAVGAVAVLAAAAMVTGQPAATRAPFLATTAIGTAHLYGVAGESSVHAAVNLPAPGRQLYQVSVSDAATGAYRTDVQRVILGFVPPAGTGLASERVQLEPSGDPGLWTIQGAHTPVVGTWQLEVIVRREGLRDESATFPLPVAEPLPPQPVPPPDIGVGVPLPLGALWSVLPTGVAGWLVPLLLLGAAGAMGLLDRRRRQHALGLVQAGVVLLAVVAGIGVASRAAVTAANDPTPAQAAAANPIPSSAQSLARGAALYAANCASCHGTGGAGDGPTAATIFPPPRPLAEVVPSLRDGAIAYRIAVGTAGTRMPAFAATLSENDRWDLVNYLRATWPGDQP